MRVAVLPRDVAARVITGSIARAAWTVSAASIGVTIPILIEFLVQKHALAGLPLPLAILIGMFAFTVGAYFHPRPWVVVSYLVVGAVGAIFFQLTLISAHPDVIRDGLYLLNRPSVSLVLVAVAATTTLMGVAWTTAGFVVSIIVAAIVAGVAGVPVVMGWGPPLFFAMFVFAYLMLQQIQTSQRRKLPNFDELELETRRLGAEENMRSRVASVVHDTLLNDLSIVMTAPDHLDDRMRTRLREDLETLTSTEWLHESSEVVVTDDQDSELRNQVMLIISDLQWRGLTVHVTGSGTGIYRLAPDAATAIVDAIRASLENVLRHSGTTIAELDLAYTKDEVAAMVSDQGGGFDPESIASDRLGLRQSVVERIRAVGGSVRIWSTPGAGTSIVMRVPVLELVAEHEPSGHEQAVRPTSEEVSDAGT